MANTVIAIRSSGTAAATPSLGVLANGELSINYADGIIYYKTSANTLGSIRTTQPAGLTTEVQYNDAGSFGSNANFTFNKTIATLNVKNINVTTNLVATNLTATSITTGSGAGGIIAGANVIYSNVFVANTGGITTTGNSTLNGIVTVSYVAGAGNQNAAMEMIGANTKGGTGYFDFISANNNSAGTTNRNKYFRVDSNGKLQIINSAYTVNIFDLNDSGYLTIPGALATSQYIQFSDGSKQYTANAGSGGGSVAASSITGVMNLTQGGTNAASYTTGAFLTSNGTSFASVANTGTAGTYANAAYVPVITTDAYGRVSAVTNTLIQIATSQITSGALPFAQGGTNAASYTTGALLTSNGTSLISLANTGTAGTYGNATFIPVITTDAYGRVSSVTNTAISIPTAYSNTNVAAFLVSNSFNISANVVTANSLYVTGNIYAGKVFETIVSNTSTYYLPLVVSDISPQFDGQKTVFTILNDQSPVANIVDSKNVEVIVNGMRLAPYVKQNTWPWITTYDSHKGFRIVSSNVSSTVTVYNAPAPGDQAVITIINSSPTPQTRKYPYSAATIALGD
jgi:hypothetical protein